jgi:hypothetical protein
MSDAAARLYSNDTVGFGIIVTFPNGSGSNQRTEFFPSITKAQVLAEVWHLRGADWKIREFGNNYGNFRADLVENVAI